MQEWEQGIRPCPQPLADGRRGAAAIGSLIREPIWPGQKRGKREGMGGSTGQKRWRDGVARMCTNQEQGEVCSKMRGSKGWRLQLSLAPIWQLGPTAQCGDQWEGVFGWHWVGGCTNVLLWLG